MSFYIPLPRNAEKPRKEFIAAITQEFIVDTPYARLRVHEVASLWAAFIEARTAHAELADKPLTSEHHSNRVRAHRRVAAQAGRVYHNGLRDLTNDLPRQPKAEPPANGASLVAARAGTGHHANLRTTSTHQRMEREAQQAQRAAGGARG